MAKGKNQWYPSQNDFPDPKQFNVVRQLTDMVYKLQGQHDTLKSSIESQSKDVKTLKAKPEPGGPSTTKIAGLYVRGVKPKDGQVLTYVGSTGQIEFM